MRSSLVTQLLKTFLNISKWLHFNSNAEFFKGFCTKINIYNENKSVGKMAFWDSFFLCVLPGLAIIPKIWR